MDKNHDVIIFISKYLTRPGVASFGNIKIATMFIKTTFKDAHPPLPPPEKKEKEKIETKY